MSKRRGRGEGSFEQLPSGSWRVVLSRVIDGERVRMTKAFPTKQEAVEWRDRNKANVAKPGTLKDWLEAWLELIKPDVASTTYKHERFQVKRWLLPLLGTAKIRDLTPLRIKQVLARMKEDGRSDSERHKAGATLRNALNSAVANGLLQASPMATVKLPTPKRPEKRVLDPDQLARFIEAAGDWSYAFRLWADAGLRPGELYALTWEDIDLARGTVSVRRALDGVTNKVKEPKTRKSRRTIPLAASTVAALVARPGTGLFLPNPSGGMWWASNFHDKFFEPIRKRAGLPWVLPYTFRHTMASLLIRAGVPIKVVSERLGHEDVATTLRTYAHVMEGDQEKAAAEMERILNPPVPHDSPTPPK